MAAIKQRQRMEKKQAETEKKTAEQAAKDAEKQQKQQERQQKKAEEYQKKANVQKLRDRRLARKLPEFKEYLRKAGVCQEASPNYLAQLMDVLRRYVAELKNELHPNNERKRKVRSDYSYTRN
jgi:ribosomal protein S4